MTVAADISESHVAGLRVCLAVRTCTVPQWVAAVAEALSHTESVELIVAVVGSTSSVALPENRRFTGPLWRFYQTLDLRLQRLTCRKSVDPAATTDIRMLGCTVVNDVPADTVLVVNVAGPGVLSRLAAHSPHVWWFDHDGQELWPAVKSGYPEVLASRVTHCRLVGFIAGASSPGVLRSARLATHPLFGAENRVQLLWKTIPLLSQKVRELRDCAAVTWESVDQPPELDQSPPREEGHKRLTLALARHAWRSAGFVLRRLLWREQWFLLLGEQGDGPASAFRPARALIPAADRYWADPHLLPHGADRLILVEEYLHAEHRGRIALLRLGDCGEVAEVQTVLEKDCHLSYPAVFELDGELYMVPESRELGRVDAYKCTSYPWHWELAETLLTGVWACDSSIVKHGGRWWMFATVSNEPWLTPRDSLNVYYADDPLNGPWHSHQGNPVVCDAHSARPAGRPFIRDGCLYRPSQDCSHGYGHGIHLNEVTTLTESRFEEREVIVLEPSWHEAVATHTFASGDGTIVVDAMRWLRRDYGLRLPVRTGGLRNASRRSDGRLLQ